MWFALLKACSGKSVTYFTPGLPLSGNSSPVLLRQATRKQPGRSKWSSLSLVEGVDPSFLVLSAAFQLLQWKRGFINAAVVNGHFAMDSILTVEMSPVVHQYEREGIPQANKQKRQDINSIDLSTVVTFPGHGTLFVTGQQPGWHHGTPTVCPCQ